MKILYLPLALLLWSCDTAKTTKTGIVYAGHFELIDKTLTREKWNAALLKKGFSARLSVFRIRKGRDAANDSSYYYLFAEAEDNSLRMATLLSRKKNYFYLERRSELVICTCGDGTPQREDSRWICEMQQRSDCEETIIAHLD